ncbi:MAG: hypothetical protein AB7V77_02750 [Candidatus Woesearchaeota archaeon]
MKLTIVGSIKFVDKYKEVKKYLEEKGHQIILPIKDEIEEPLPPEVKLKAMEVFNKNLKESDGILVMNYEKNNEPNYMGVNSLMEIGMAFNRGKKIFIFNSIPEFCKDEVKAIGSVELNGNLDLI